MGYNIVLRITLLMLDYSTDIPGATVCRTFPDLLMSRFSGTAVTLRLLWSRVLGGKVGVPQHAQLPELPFRRLAGDADNHHSARALNLVSSVDQRS